MIEKAIYFIFVMGIITGLAGILSVLWWPTVAGIDSLPEPQRSVRRQKRLGRGFYTLVCAVSGLAFSLTRVSSPLEMLLGAVLARGLMEIALRNWKPKILSKPRSVARDVRTGQPVGELVSETREWSSGRVEAFKMRTAQGNLIERSADSVTIASEDRSTKRDMDEGG